MHQKDQTRKRHRDLTIDSDCTRVKITGPNTNVVADVQDALAEFYKGRIILSPILRSTPQGFHAFATISEDDR